MESKPETQSKVGEKVVLARSRDTWQKFLNSAKPVRY